MSRQKGQSHGLPATIKPEGLCVITGWIFTHENVGFHQLEVWVIETLTYMIRKSSHLGALMMQFLEG